MLRHNGEENNVLNEARNGMNRPVQTSGAWPSRCSGRSGARGQETCQMWIKCYVRYLSAETLWYWKLRWHQLRGESVNDSIL